VGIVVTPETADRCDVPFIVGIRAPRHLHRRKYVAAANILGGRDGLRHGVLILGLGFTVGLVEAPKPLVDRLFGCRRDGFRSSPANIAISSAMNTAADAVATMTPPIASG
jgi:hypothetical protein